MIKAEKKARMLHGFFASVLLLKIGCSSGTQLPKLEERDREHNEDSIIQEEMVSNLICHLGMHKSMGPGVSSTQEY